MSNGFGPVADTKTEDGHIFIGYAYSSSDNWYEVDVTLGNEDDSTVHVRVQLTHEQLDNLRRQLNGYFTVAGAIDGLPVHRAFADHHDR
jgi:hypothetical protein